MAEMSDQLPARQSRESPGIYRCSLAVSVRRCYSQSKALWARLQVLERNNNKKKVGDIYDQYSWPSEGQCETVIRESRLPGLSNKRRIESVRRSWVSPR